MAGSLEEEGYGTVVGVCSGSDVDCGVEAAFTGDGGVFEEAKSATAGSALVAGSKPVSSARVRIDLKM